MYDYHTHTSFSDDCESPMKSMIEQACKLNIKELAITDHFDPDYPDKNFPFIINFEKYHQALLEAEETYKNKIRIVKGLEIGLQVGAPLKKGDTAAKAFAYDFILGSFHCADGHDLYGGEFFQDKTPLQAYLTFYEEVYNCLCTYQEYDILGHINIIDRYAPEIPLSSTYDDLVDIILRRIIDDGKGLEFNTSSFRYQMGDRTIPTNKILQRYRDLGGEIITMGSDAHQPDQIAYAFPFAKEVLQATGFRYFTTFDQRKPDFIKF